MLSARTYALTNTCVTLAKPKSKLNCRCSISTVQFNAHRVLLYSWLEACIKEAVPPTVDLEEGLRSGVILAKLAKFFDKTAVRKIFEDSKLQFRHTDNYNSLYTAMQHISVPDVFFFETTDLYEKKNFPKVIYCVHALAHLLFKMGRAPDKEPCRQVALYR